MMQNESIHVLLLGSGGREHALSFALAKSKGLGRLYAAPGNPGIGKLAELVPLKISDHAAVIAFCKAHNIGFVVVGPEAPLVAGIVDDLNAAGILAFGPSRYAAQLEGSKGFTKDICAANNIPTAAYARFKALAPALAYLKKMGAPIVVKRYGCDDNCRS
jgi:phosphoribosylamine---glycine ligase